MSKFLKPALATLWWVANAAIAAIVIRFFLRILLIVGCAGTIGFVLIASMLLWALR